MADAMSTVTFDIDINPVVPRDVARIQHDIANEGAHDTITTT